jgi:dihydroxy-acid dehydratase
MPASRARRRSRDWFDDPEIYGWLRTAALRGLGLTADASDDRPIIGICNTWSELTHCNAHLRQVADAVRRGVWQAGGLPLEFPVLSPGEFNMRPTAMLYRNLASMDVEEAIQSNPLDAVVLLGGCDKTTPALLMGAASADVPAVLVTGGPQLNAHWRGETVGSCTDCRRYQTELRAGRITAADWADLQGSMIRSPGHCMTMGTASTMACVAEALGIAPPGNAAIPAADSRRLQLAETAGRYAVDMANRDVRPSHILTPAAFDNAIRILHAIGGSTNAVIHLIAIAGRLGIDLKLDRFDELSRSTPLLVDLKPTGRFLMEDFCYAGGVPALMTEMGPFLDLMTPTVTGRTLGENCAGARVWSREVIRPLDRPLHVEGGVAVLRGSLAPAGAIIKPAAATAALLTHRGRAVVFEDHDDLVRRVDDPDLDVRPEDVLVLRNAGPIGGPGMPEWGFLPIPRKLLAAGLRDMVRVSDARMSGTAFGTVVVHVSPESAAGGPLAAVRNGDLIDLDVPKRRLDLVVEPEEVVRRLANRTGTEPRPDRGYGWLYARHVLQAEHGCDFDFLRAANNVYQSRARSAAE